MAFYKGYKRHSYGRKRTYGMSKGYRKYKKSRYGGKGLVKMIKAVTLKVAETKSATNDPYWTGAINNTGSLSGGIYQYIAKGTDPNQRVGAKITCRGIKWFGLLMGGQTGAVGDDLWNQIRIVIFTAPSTTVLADLGTAPSITTIWTHENVRKYQKVLYDKKFFLRSNAISGNGYLPALRKFKVWIKLNDIMTWSSGTNTNKDIFIYAVSDSSAIPHPSIVEDSITRYWKDI